MFNGTNANIITWQSVIHFFQIKQILNESKITVTTQNFQPKFFSNLNNFSLSLLNWTRFLTLRFLLKNVVPESVVDTRWSKRLKSLNWVLTQISFVVANRYRKTVNLTHKGGNSVITNPVSMDPSSTMPLMLNRNHKTLTGHLNLY